MKAKQSSALLFLAIVGTALGLLSLMLMLDMTVHTQGLQSIYANLLHGGLVNAMAPLPEVMAALLGLTLTIVAIVVQLAAQRYSPKVADMFLKDRTNLVFFFFMLVSCTYVVLLPAVAIGEGMTAQVSILLGLILCVSNFSMLLPYFAYVFSFLQPSNIIRRIQRGAIRQIDILISHPQPLPAQVSAAQDQIVAAIEHISDSCIAAIEHGDRYLAIYTIDILEELLRDYIDREDRLPAGWENPDRDYFMVLSQRHYEEIVRAQVWVEAKILYELEHAFRRALRTENQELLIRIASATRAVGLKANAVQDHQATWMVVRFFNTFVRQALNTGQVRTGYSVLYQYRTLAQDLLNTQQALFLRVCEYLTYYGRLASAMNQPFVTVTVAHDLVELCLTAHDMDRALSGAVLQQMFSIGDIDEEHNQQTEIGIGVLQAFSILGARLLERDDPAMAARIQEFFQAVPLATRRQAYNRVMAVRDWQFWEITDRGEDFNYLAPQTREHLKAFFEPLLSSSLA